MAGRKSGTTATGSQGHNFSEIASAEIPRSTFNRSSTLKTAFNGGLLIPIFWDEMLPGDTIKLKQRSFVRLGTPLVAVMDEIYLETQYYFIPLRIIWDLYPRFMGEQPNPDDSIDFTVPVMVSPGGQTAIGTLSDYLGVPPSALNITHSSLAHRAYNACFNDWYRDVNLQDKVVLDTDAGPDTYGDYQLKRRGKRKDYFTSGLPWPQRGDPINLLFDGTVPITSTGDGIPEFTINAVDGFTLKGDGATQIAIWDGANPALAEASWDKTKLEGDLSAASANTINGLRSAFAVQRLLERDARGGARLKEILKAHFKVTSDDARLDRPEYLGGSSITINIQPVGVTTQNTNANVGDVGGTGVGIGSSSAIMYSATEHGIIMGICAARAPLSYQQGLNAKFNRRTRYDFFWPAFSHIGEAPIANKEIFAVGAAEVLQDDAVFAYQEAWSPYRYRPNEISGKMRSYTTAPLDIWHLAQDFSALPVLDDTFIQDTPPFGRVIAVPAEPEFLGDFAFDIQHTRPMPTFSTPGLIDHF